MIYNQSSTETATLVDAVLVRICRSQIAGLKIFYKENISKLRIVLKAAVRLYECLQTVYKRICLGGGRR